MNNKVALIAGIFAVIASGTTKSETPSMKTERLSNKQAAIVTIAAFTASGDLPKLNEPAPDHKSVRLKVPAKAGPEKTSVVFDLVYKGHGHIQ